MPLLQYQCLECREKFEELVFSAPPLCPHCGSGSLQQIYEGKSLFGSFSSSSSAPPCAQGNCPGCPMAKQLR